MKYDLIIVAKSSDPQLIAMTQQTIDTARVDGADMRVIIVETGPRYEYDVDVIVMYEEDFCYNHALNIGLREAKGEIHLLANNDLVFHPGWSKIGDIMQANNCHSASMLSQDMRQRYFERGEVLYEGYNVGSHITGWLILLDDYCLSKIGQLDESFKFWYSDDIYALQLRAAGVKHYLVCNCEVDHITSQTLRKQPNHKKRAYQTGEYNKFKNIKRKYESKMFKNA